MIKLSGVLTIRTINGRKGVFNVGRLATDIGEFAVKETLLEQYEEGHYEGDFGITRIYPSQYSVGSRVVTEIRAVLATMALANIDDLDHEEAHSPDSEPDPVDEPVSTLPSAQAEPVIGDGEAIAGEEDDVVLFGDLWPLGTEVKLDPTVDRMQFRQQRDRLKALGYRFQALGQVWIRSAAVAEQAA